MVAGLVSGGCVAGTASRCFRKLTLACLGSNLQVFEQLRVFRSLWIGPLPVRMWVSCYTSLIDLPPSGI